MKVYIVAVYDLMICIKQDNLVPNISRAIFSSAGWGYLLVI